MYRNRDAGRKEGNPRWIGEGEWRRPVERRDWLAEEEEEDKDMESGEGEAEVSGNHVEGLSNDRPQSLVTSHQNEYIELTMTARILGGWHSGCANAEDDNDRKDGGVRIKYNLSFSRGVPPCNIINTGRGNLTHQSRNNRCSPNHLPVSSSNSSTVTPF